MARSAPVAFVLPWFSRNDYPLMRRVLADGGMPATFGEWLARAEAICRQVGLQGGIVERLPIEALVFHRWCMTTGRAPNEEALSKYVTWHVDPERHVLLEHITGGGDWLIGPSRAVH